MKLHTTNAQNTLIAIADDCKATKGEIPPIKAGKLTIANIQYEIITKHPYQYTSDDVIFECYVIKNRIPNTPEAKSLFFSKGQPCLRTSPLTKKYGWGVHNNDEGKIALFSCDSETYKTLLTDPTTKVVKAMKSTR